MRKAREFAAEFEYENGYPIPSPYLAKKLADENQIYTQVGSMTGCVLQRARSQPLASLCSGTHQPGALLVTFCLNSLTLAYSFPRACLASAASGEAQRSGDYDPRLC